MKILLVEDDRILAEAIAQILKTQHYLVESAKTGNEGWELAQMFSYDLILLDVGLPDFTGLELCHKLRNRGDRTPILLMTGHTDQQKKVAGLDAGADDYLVKPFDFDELLARVRALLRRGNDHTSPVLEWGKLCLEPNSCQVTYDNQLLRLTAKEYEIIELFLRNPQRIYSQSILLDRLWNFEDPPSENAVRTQIKGLRQKLKKAGAGDLIETLYGLGYRLKSPHFDLTPYQPLPQLASVWKRSRDKYLQRLVPIEKAIAALKNKTFSTEIQEQAQREAHTLAGSLGSFGFKKLSQECRQIEEYLQTDPIPLESLKEAVINLQEHIKIAGNQDQRQPPQSPEKTYALTPPTPTRKNPPFLLIIDSDSTLTHPLVQGLQKQNIETQITRNLTQAHNAIATATHQPDLILLDLGLSSLDQSLAFLSKQTHKTPPIPTVVMSADNSLSLRVKVARLGALGFLAKPLEIENAIATLYKLLNPTALPVAQLLIVDDDPQILELLNTLLKPWGFKLHLLPDPERFWKTLETVSPDLLLLDVKMPNVSGIDLCQVVRNDPTWHSLPILMLSAYRDQDMIQKVFFAGADDYIQKPIVEPELIARILNRLERRQLWHKLTAGFGIINN